MIAQADASFGEHDVFIARMDNFIDDILHIVRGHELAFFHVDAFSRRSSRFDEIGLPAQESRNLHDIEDFCSRFHLADFMNVTDDRHLEFLFDVA